MASEKIVLTGVANDAMEAVRLMLEVRHGVKIYFFGETGVELGENNLRGRRNVVLDVGYYFYKKRRGGIDLHRTMISVCMALTQYGWVPEPAKMSFEGSDFFVLWKNQRGILSVSIATGGPGNYWLVSGCGYGLDDRPPMKVMTYAERRTLMRIGRPDTLNL